MCQYFEQPQQRLRKGNCLRYTTGNPQVIPAQTALLHLRRWHRSQGGQATSPSGCLWPLCPWTGSAHRAGMVLELLHTPHPPFRWSWCFHSYHAEWLGGGKKSAHYCRVELDSKLDHFTWVLSEEYKESGIHQWLPQKLLLITVRSTTNRCCTFHV